MKPLNIQHLYYDSVSTPYGKCFIMSTKTHICWASTPGGSLAAAQAWAQKYNYTKDILKGSHIPVLQKAVDEMKRYFAGEQISFSGPFEFIGTDFQKSVWNSLVQIPHGETKTYGHIATLIGNAKASRAVGNANNKNPIAIMIPCHRVVGSTGKLVGYAGGLKTKEWLLSLEKNNYGTHTI